MGGILNTLGEFCCAWQLEPHILTRMLLMLETMQQIVDELNKMTSSLPATLVIVIQWY